MPPRRTSAPCVLRARHRRALALAVAALLAPASVAAQTVETTAPSSPQPAPPQPASPQPAAPAGTPPSPTAAATPDSPQVIEARQRQQRGRSLYDAGNYSAALTEFERVYALLEGRPRRYVALANIARTYQRLGQFDRAMEFYRRYLSEGGAAGDERATVEAAILALDDLLGTARIASNGPADVWIDHRDVGRAPGDVRVPSGHHLVELHAPGYVVARREFELASHESVELRFVLVRPAGGPPPAVFFTGVVASVVVAAAGATFGTIALVDRADVLARSTSADPLVRFTVNQDDNDRLMRWATVADALYITAGALAIGTTVLFFLTDWRHGTAHAGARSARVGLVPGASPRGADLAVEVRF
jgi:tetratricopeptide (TPR) repeat protein